ncbi:MAG: Ppx/GppA phosphatase family protein [Candidatus Zixiibacteriota bacterium]
MGTYSGLILIARRTKRGWTVLEEEQHTVDLLGDGLQRGALPRSAIARAEGLVRRFDALTTRHKCRHAAVVATAALRSASNRTETIRRLRSVTKHPVRVLAARREGILGFRGALIGLPKSEKRSIVVDIGGGSTEAVRETDSGWIFRGVSCGASKATASWAGVSKGSSAELMTRADDVVSGLPRWNRKGNHRIVGVGGSAVTLAALQARHRRLHPEKLHGRALTRDWLERTAERLARLSRADIERLIPFDPKRARVITAGTFLWVAVLKHFEVDRVIISARGLRWGVADYLSEHGRI